MSLTKVTNDLLALGENTSSLNLPKGTTAQRPTSPVAGMVRENTDDNVIEYYNGTEWKQVLNSSAVSTIPFNYLIIGGGGGGAGTGGGGGAGGVLSSSSSFKKGFIYEITIGAGAVGGLYPRQASSGSDTILVGNNINILTAIGGGGGSHSQSGFDGGSGGGGGYGSDPQTRNGGFGTAGQGNNGGIGIYTPNYPGGGGGGAGAIGTDAPNGSTGGSGGNGIQSSITGTSEYFGGGGGAGVRGGTGGSGGLGGGGAGSGTTTGSPGESNKGGGGGSGSSNTVGAASGANGGSGVVILRLLTSEYSGITTGSPTVTTDGDYTVLTYTSSGTYTA